MGDEYISPIAISSGYNYLIPSNPSEIRFISSSYDIKKSRLTFSYSVYGEIKRYFPYYSCYTSSSLSTNAEDWYDVDMDGKMEVKGNKSQKIYSIDLGVGSTVLATQNWYSTWININNDDYIDYYVSNGPRTSTMPASSELHLGGENYSCSMIYKGNESGYILNPIDYDNNGSIDFLKRNKNDADDISPNILVVGASDSIYDAKMDIMTLDEYLGKPKTGANTGVGIPSISDEMFVPSSTTDTESFTSYMTADINGDALPDLIDVDYGKIYYNAGNGQWVLSDFGGKVLLRDLNGDGVQDYIVYDSSAKTVTSYIYQKEGAPKQQKLISNMVCGSRIWCYDFDKDNDVDILIPFNYIDNSASYLLLMENKGDGTFKKHENYIEDKANFCECLDIDGDGKYEVIASCETSDNSSIERSSLYIYESKAYKIDGVSVNTIGTVICEKIAEDYQGKSYDLLVADINNSGKLNLIIDLRSIAPISKVANQRPLAPEKPEYYYDSSTGNLKVSWGYGSDAESSPVDLTYALRIGTAPDKGDYLFAHALPDGSRRNMIDGNQGYSQQRVIDTSTWPAGKYYISVQSVDPNHLGSQFSEYAIFEKSMPENGFEVSYKNPFAIHDTCMVYLTNAPVEGYVYNWDFDGAEVLSKNEDGSIYKLSFHTPGEKNISLQVSTVQGALSIKKEKTLYVSQANIKECKLRLVSEGYCPVFALDIDEDGLAEALGSSSSGDKFMNSNIDDTFTTIKRLWNNNTNISKFNSFYSATIDINNDGMCDAIAPTDGVYHLINLGDGDMEVSDLLSEQRIWSDIVVDVDNDGFYDLIGYNYSRDIYKNSGDYINFTKFEEYDEFLYDYNKDGLIDKIVEERGATTEDLYAYINLGDAFQKDAKIFSIIGDPAAIGDFDNDGKADLVYLVSGDPYLLKIQWGDGSDDVISSIPKTYTDYIYVFDFDNNGYLDIYISFDDFDHEIVFTSADRKFTIEELSQEDTYALDLGYWERNIRPFKSASGNFFLAKRYQNIRIIGENERPTAPTGLRSQQTDKAVILEWNPSADKETASCNMQYNLSVKRKGASGEGAYLFSPCNSTKNGVPVPSHKPLISSTMFTIPIANIPAGEYEVQVQGVDGMREASDFSEVYNLVVKESCNLQMATTTGLNVVVQAILTGNTTPTVDWGEAQVVQVSNNTYNLTWTTPGMKTVNVDGDAYNIYVNPLPEGEFTLPESILAKATVNVKGQNMNSGRWEVSANDGEDYEVVDSCSYVKLTVIGSENIVASFLRSGNYILRHTVSDAYNSIQYIASTVVTDDVTTQEIAIVSIDSETGKHVIKWDGTTIPAEALSINVYKETSRVNEYQLIDNVAIATQSYVDSTSLPEVLASRYRLSYVLNYGESELSKAHQAIHVMINQGMGNSWNLMWSKYEGMDVTSYRILRGTTPENLSVIAEVSGNMSSYSDIEVDSNDGEVLYYAVEIVSPSIVPMSTKTSLMSRSNVVSIVNAQNVDFVNAITIVPADGKTMQITSVDTLSLKLKANIYPTWATLQRVNWIVYSGEDIATIDQSGVLTANGKANGEVVVRTYAIDGSGIYGEIGINVDVKDISGIENEYSKAIDCDALKIYPSPAETEVTILGMDDLESTTIYVFSINGELMCKEVANQKAITINCDNFVPGIYYVKTQSSTEVKTGRFIKK